MTVVNHPRSPALPPLRTPPLPAPPPATVPTEPGRDEGQQFVLNDVTWEQYEAVGEALRDRPGVYLTYDRGVLEFMTLSRRHDRWKKWLGRLVETLCEEFGIPMEPGGSMTFKRKSLGRGLEPDECFWIANEAKMRGRLDFDSERDAPPDLVIEVEASRSATDRMGIYAAMGVAEVWRFDGETLSVHVLAADGTYHLGERSPTFPAVAPTDIVRFARPRADVDYLGAISEFRAWVRSIKP